MSTEDLDVGYPVAFVTGGEPIPDLLEMPQEEWLAAVLPLSDFGRTMAMRRRQIEGMYEEYTELLLNLPPPGARRTELAKGMPAPRAEAELRPRTAYRQVSIRLAQSDHENLCLVAADLGMKPGQLVRAFVANGVGRLLFERRRREGS